MSVVRLNVMAGPQTTTPEFAAAYDAHDFNDLSSGSTARRLIPPLLVVESLRLFDIIAIAIAGFCAYAIQITPDAAGPIDRYPGGILLGCAVAALASHALGTYRAALVHSPWLGTGRAIAGWLAAFAVLLGAAYLLKASEYFSRQWAMAWLASALGLLLVGRYVLCRVTLRLARRGCFASRALVIGTGEQAARLATHLQAQGAAATQIVGFIDDSELVSRAETSSLGYPTVGVAKHLMATVRRSACDEVIVALPWSEDRRIEQLNSLLKNSWPLAA